MIIPVLQVACHGRAFPKHLQLWFHVAYTAAVPLYPLALLQGHPFQLRSTPSQVNTNQASYLGLPHPFLQSHCTD